MQLMLRSADWMNGPVPLPQAHAQLPTLLLRRHLMVAPAGLLQQSLPVLQVMALGDEFSVASASLAHCRLLQEWSGSMQAVMSVVFVKSF